MSSLRLQNKAHEVCSKVFLRVAYLCEVFAYRTRHTKCVVSYLFRSLSYVRSSLTNKQHEVCSKLFLRVAQLCEMFAYRTRHTKCVVSYFFRSLSYVRSSLTEQGTQSVQ